ncbi:MAG: carbon storage regulator [Planctomycetaceae bacterium]|nr:carbon storage regulator [Planctomycetaceae bacterium]
MLVLSRSPGQSVVIDDQIVVTLERCDDGSADLRLANIRGVPLGGERLFVNHAVRLPRDVEVVLVQSASDKVRLGFECQGELRRQTRIEKKENWDQLHGLT